MIMLIAKLPLQLKTVPDQHDSKDVRNFPWHFNYQMATTRRSSEIIRLKKNLG